MTKLIGKCGHYLLEFHGDFISDLSSLGLKEMSYAVMFVFRVCVCVFEVGRFVGRLSWW